jgi:hypothetical protein
MSRPRVAFADLTPRQRDTVRAVKTHRKVYVVGGNRSGKSFGCTWAAVWFTWWGAPRSHGLAFAPTLQQLKDLFIEKWKMLAPPGYYEINTHGTREVGPHILCYHPRRGRPPYTTYIYLRSEEASARIEGVECAWAYGEEIQDCEDAWKLADLRLSDDRAPHLCLFGAGLPEIGWLDEKYSQLPETPGDDFNRVDPATSTRWLRLRTGDNREHLAAGYEEHQRTSLSVDEYEKRNAGAFVAASDAVYPTFSRALHVKPCPPRPGLKLWVGVDFNNQPMSAVFMHLEGEVFRVVGELVIDAPTTTPQHAENIKAWCEREGFDWGDVDQVELVPDASGRSTQHTGKSDHQMLREAGLHLTGPAANPHVKDRDNAVTARLLNAARQVRLFIDPGCVRTIAAMSKLRRADRKPSSKSPYTHPVDALGYPIAWLKPISAGIQTPIVASPRPTMPRPVGRALPRL